MVIADAANLGQQRVGFGMSIQIQQIDRSTTGRLTPIPFECFGYFLWIGKSSHSLPTLNAIPVQVSPGLTVRQPACQNHMASNPFQAEHPRGISRQIGKMGYHVHLDPRLHEKLSDQFFLKLPTSSVAGGGLRKDDEQTSGHGELSDWKRIGKNLLCSVV